MSQDEVFSFLQMQRMMGENRYWRKMEIHHALIRAGIVCSKSKQCITGRKVNMLYAHGFLEVKVDPNKFWGQSYRVYDKYLTVRNPSDVNVWFKEE